MARIIIADDDEIVGEIARDALIGYGHGAGLVPDGREALRVVQARRPDLLVLDCNMPEISGVLVLRELRNSPSFCDLPTKSRFLPHRGVAIEVAIGERAQGLEFGEAESVGARRERADNAEPRALGKAGRALDRVLSV